MSVESVKTALRVLELVAAEGPVGVSELARETCEPKTTVQRSLVTLHEAGWIRPVEDGARRRWSLTSKVLTLARHLQPAPGLRDAALDVMEALRMRTQETIHLTLRDGDRVVLIERLDSPQPLRTVRPLGSTAPLHVNSNGKAILAFLPEAERNAYLNRHLEAWTPKSLTNPKALERDLARVRRRGYALNDGELDVHIRAVAGVILDGNKLPIAALSISCPAFRLPDKLVRDYGVLVRDAAHEIASRMGEVSRSTVAERVSALRTESYLAERSPRADIPKALGVLDRAGLGRRPEKGDEKPKPKPTAKRRRVKIAEPANQKI